VSSGTIEDVFDRIAEERSRPTFDVNIPTWSRALFLPMAANNKMVWTDRGIQWLVETIIELAPINATTTSRMLNTFQHVHRLKPELRDKVTTSLRRIVQEVSEAASPTIHGQARAYLGE
jgi:aminopeptidase N